MNVQTDLIVDGLCGGWRRERLVYSPSGIKSHGLSWLCLWPETFRKHALLIIENSLLSVKKTKEELFWPRSDVWVPNQATKTCVLEQVYSWPVLRPPYRFRFQLAFGKIAISCC